MAVNGKKIAGDLNGKKNELDVNSNNEIGVAIEKNLNNIIKQPVKNDNNVGEMEVKKMSLNIPSVSSGLTKDCHKNGKEIAKNNIVNGTTKDIIASLEDAQKKIEEVGDFSVVLKSVLSFLLKKSQSIEESLFKENEARKVEIETKSKKLEQTLQEENTKLKQIIKKENEERQRDMKDIEGFVKKENADRKKETTELTEKLKSDEEKRKTEAKSLEDKIAREKRELEEYLKKDALEHKQKMELENRAIKDKLDKESSDLKKKMSEADDEKSEEMKILQQRLDNERKVLQEKMEREKAELAEEMEKAEQERKSESAKLKNKLEEDKKQQESGIVKMFERLKGENESRKTEIHGLKDILVRENDRLSQEQLALETSITTGLQELDEKLIRELGNCKADIKKTVIDEITDTMNADKKELKNKIDSDYNDLKRRVEVETNEIRDKIQFDKKAMVIKFDEVEDERQKEAKLIRTQLQREREETRECITSEVKILQNQVEGTATDLMEIIKKEKVDRERGIDTVKRRIDDEKQELQETINRDRNNLTKKMNDEHDQRRIEQLEVQQRLENTEKAGKNDIAELFTRVKRYEDESRIDNDEVRQAVNRTASTLEEKLIRDKKELRDMLEYEASDLGRRVDKCNTERLNDSADMQGKMCMLGKSASRHLESLKIALHRETHNLVELASKTGSVMFSAYRDEELSTLEESNVTFTGCSVNLGNGFIPKCGVFQCPEPGLYLFTITVCTAEGKQCLLMLRKNDKNISTLLDQKESETKGKTMISQTCFMELDISDRVQLISASGSAFSDSSTSHLTQFSGVLMRAPQETFKAAIRSISEDENVSIAEGFRGFTPSRGTTPSRGFTPARSRGITPEPIVTEATKPKIVNQENVVDLTPVNDEHAKADDKAPQSYSAVAKKAAPKAAPGTSKTTPNTPKVTPSTPATTTPPSAPATPKSAGATFYSFLKR